VWHSKAIIEYNAKERNTVYNSWNFGYPVIWHTALNYEHKKKKRERESEKKKREIAEMKFLWNVAGSALKVKLEMKSYII
jgi:hypothetical protein